MAPLASVTSPTDQVAVPPLFKVRERFLLANAVVVMFNAAVGAIVRIPVPPKPPPLQLILPVTVVLSLPAKVPPETLRVVTLIASPLLKVPDPLILSVAPTLLRV